MKIDCSSCGKSYFLEESKSKYDAFKVKCPSCDQFLVVQREVLTESAKKKEAAIKKAKEKKASLILEQEPELLAAKPEQFSEEEYFFSLEELAEAKEDSITEDQKRWSHWAKEFAKNASSPQDNTVWAIRPKSFEPNYKVWALGGAFLGLLLLGFLWNWSSSPSSNNNPLPSLNSPKQPTMVRPVLVNKDAGVTPKILKEIKPVVPSVQPVLSVEKEEKKVVSVPNVSGPVAHPSKTEGTVKPVATVLPKADKNDKPPTAVSSDKKGPEGDTQLKAEQPKPAEKKKDDKTDDELDALIDGRKPNKGPAKAESGDLTSLLDRATGKEAGAPAKVDSPAETREMNSIKKTLSGLPAAIGAKCTNEVFETKSVRFSFVIGSSGNVTSLSVTPEVPVCVKEGAKGLKFAPAQTSSQTIAWPYVLTLKSQKDAKDAGGADDF